MDPESEASPKELDGGIVSENRKNYSLEFQRQFDDVKTVSTDKGDAIYRILNPENLSSEKSPVIFLSGWAMDGEANKPLLNEFVQQGISIIPIDCVGKGDIGSLFGSELKRKAQVIGEVIDKIPDKKLNILAHSMSSVILDELIKIRPELLERFESVLLAAPIGQGGRDNLVNFIVRQRKETERINSTQTPQEAESGLIYAEKAESHAKNHPIQSIKEIGAMAFANRYGMLDTLNRHNIPTGLIFGEEDELISADRIMNRIGEGYRSPFVKSDETPSGYKYDPDRPGTFRERILSIVGLNRQIDSKTTPPMKLIVKTGGGHEKLGLEGYAKKMIRAFSQLEVEDGYRKESKFVGKEEESQ